MKCDMNLRKNIVPPYEKKLTTYIRSNLMMQTLGVSFEYVGQNFMAICVKEMYVLVLRIPSKIITALAISIFATYFFCQALFKNKKK